MPHEITDNLPVPANLLDVYGTPWVLVWELFYGKKR